MDPDNEFNVDRTLTKDDVQKLIMVGTRWRQDMPMYCEHFIVQLEVIRFAFFLSVKFLVQLCINFRLEKSSEIIASYHIVS